MISSCTTRETAQRAEAQAEEHAAPSDLELTLEQLGEHYETITLREPLGVDWPLQVVRVPVEFQHPCHVRTLDLRDSADARVEFQITDPVYNKKSLVRCSVAFLTRLRPSRNLFYKLYYNESAPEPEKGSPERKRAQSPLLTTETLLKSVMTAGGTSARVLTGSGTPENPIPASSAPPPIEAVMGADGVWRGHGELRAAYKVERWQAQVLAAGPVFAEVRIRYEFTQRRYYELTLAAAAESEWITVSESFDLGERSCFLLRAPNYRSANIRNPATPARAAEIISRLPAHSRRGATIGGLPVKRFESVAAVDGKDLLALFSVTPGRWRNPAGSEINFTRIKDSLVFHFPLGKGTRRWAFHATTLAEGSSENIFRMISRASDAPLDAILEMDLVKPRELVLLKGPSPKPQDVTEAAESIAGAVRGVQEQGFSGPPAEVLDLSELVGAARAWRRISSAGKADCPAGDLLRARLAFLGNVLYDPSFFGWNVLFEDNMPPGAGFDPGSINWLRNIERCRALAELAAALPDYPRSADWLAHAEGQFDLTLEHLVSAWGSWKQGDADHDQACRLLTQLAETLKAAGGRDFGNDPAFKEMLKYRPLER